MTTFLIASGFGSSFGINGWRCHWLAKRKVEYLYQIPVLDLQYLNKKSIDALKINTWISFYRFYRCFFLFMLYFSISLVCFTLRPSPTTHHRHIVTTVSYTQSTQEMTWTSPFTPDSPSSTWSTANITDPSVFYEEVNSTEPIITSTPITWQPTSSTPSYSSTYSKGEEEELDECSLSHVIFDL